MVSLSDADREALALSVMESANPARGISMPLIANAVIEAVEQIIERHVTEALTEAARVLRTEAAEAWGGDASWLTTGTKVANLVADWVDPSP